MTTELENFDDLFPELVEFLVKPGDKHSDTKDAYMWFKEVTLLYHFWAFSLKAMKHTAYCDCLNEFI